MEEDFVTCVGPTTTSLDGDSLDGVKLSLARWVIGWKLDDPTFYGHTDARIDLSLEVTPTTLDEASKEYAAALAFWTRAYKSAR